jgi:hypothetical protein
VGTTDAAAIVPTPDGRSIFVSDDILEMEHQERHVWLHEIARINREINEARRR